jgi:hypothetical protein
MGLPVDIFLGSLLTSTRAGDFYTLDLLAAICLVVLVTISWLELVHTWLDLIHTWVDLIHTRQDLFHTRLDLIHTRLDLIYTQLDLINTRLDLISLDNAWSIGKLLEFNGLNLLLICACTI